MKFPNEVYDVLKWIALVVLDAIGVLYKGLAAVWGWPFGEEVLTTCALISAFIGALIGVSTAEYRKSLNK